MKMNRDIIRKIKIFKGERVITLFDGVLAIAITLLIFEMPIVDMNNLDWTKLNQLFIHFTAFLISFEVLGELWLTHVRIFSMPALVEHCSPRSSLVLMFWIAVFPKATEMIAEYPSSKPAAIIYLVCIVILLLVEGLAIRIAFKNISKNAKKLDEKTLTPKEIKNKMKELKYDSELGHLYITINHRLHVEELSIAVSFITTIAAAICIVIMPILCYVFIAANIILAFIIRYLADGKSNDKMMANLNTVVEKVDEEAEE